MDIITSLHTATCEVNILQAFVIPTQGTDLTKVSCFARNETRKMFFLVLFFLAALIIFSPVLSIAVCTEGDCKNGIGTWVWESGNRYTGKFDNGKRTGHGDFTFSNGDTYSGNFLNGKFHGRGMYRYADGDIYDGQWQNGKMAGHGVLKRPDGTKQEGDYRDGAIVEKWNTNTEELHEPDSNKYPRGHVEKLMADPPEKKNSKQPIKK